MPEAGTATIWGPQKKVQRAMRWLSESKAPPAKLDDLNSIPVTQVMERANSFALPSGLHPRGCAYVGKEGMLGACGLEDREKREPG